MTLSRPRLFKLVGVGTATALLAIVMGYVSTVQQGNTLWTTIFKSFVLGIVQGITEFLPISSSAHLKVLPVVLGWQDPIWSSVSFTAVIQLGSIAAVLWYFWQDLAQLGSGSMRAIAQKDYQSNDFRMTLGILVGTLPIIFFGLLIKKFIPDFDNSPLRSMAAIGWASIGMSLLLAVAEKVGQRKRDYEHLGMKDGILMGFAQCIALIPGVSRSGSTITAGLFAGLERSTAARFSFLLGIPAITLAGLVELKDVFEVGFEGSNVVALAVGSVSATIFSYFAISLLVRFLQTQSTWVFVWYRLIFGTAILAAIALGIVPNI